MRTGRRAVSDGPRTVSSSTGSSGPLPTSALASLAARASTGPDWAIPKRPPMLRPPSTTRSSSPVSSTRSTGRLGLGRQQRPSRGIRRHGALGGLEAHGVTERDQERLLPPGIVDRAQRVPEQLPAAGPWHRVDPRLEASHRDRVGRHDATRARGGGPCAAARRARPGTGTGDAPTANTLSRARCEVDQLVAGQPGRLAHCGDAAVVAHGHANEAAAGVPAAARASARWPASQASTAARSVRRASYSTYSVV